MSIGKFSVSNPVLINVLMVVVLLLGFLSVSQLPQEQYSEVPFFWVNVIVPYPGVAAEDVEQSVTVKIENEMQDLAKLKEISSVSREGLASVRVQFDDGISNEEFDRLYQEVQTKLSNVALPEETLSPLVDQFSSSDFLPVIEVVVSGDVSYEQLYNSAVLLRDRIEAVNEVSDVELVGAREPQILVEVNQDKLESLGLTIDQVVRAVQQRNVTVPGGTLQTDSREYLLRTVGELEEYQELKEVIVRRGRDSGQGVVTLADISTITPGFEQDGVSARFNQAQAITLKVAKVPRGNSVGVIEDVKQEVEDSKPDISSDVNITLFNDSTVQIRDSIDTLLSNSVLGLVFLVIILFIFIGFRNAFITALGIPVTFAITFLVLDLLGETFNSNTLFGLVLVLGLIVDHAIVIIENSYRLMQNGLSRVDAAVNGVNEVAKPVIASTLTTVAAFLPLMLLPGVIGKFLRVIPLTVSIALLASTFEALIFLPVHFAEWSGKLKQRRRDLFLKIRAGFETFISRFYQRRYIAVAVMFLIIIGSFFLVSTVDQDLFDAEDFSLFYIDIELPPGSPNEKTNRVVQAFEERIMPMVGKGEIAALNSAIGFTSTSSSTSRSSNVAQITVDLTEKDEGRRSIIAIIEEVKQKCSDIPGVETVQYRKAQSGPPTEPPVSFRLFGDSYDELVTVARDIEQQLSTYPELYNINDNLESGTPELRVKVNDNLAARYGLNTAAIGSFIRSSFDGVTATTLFVRNEEIDVIVRYDKEEVRSVHSLMQSRIPTQDGRLIPFSSVASIEQQQPIAAIKRVDGKREVTITAEAYNEENIREINEDIRTLFDSRYKTQYPDVTLNVGGEFEELDNLIYQILRIFLVGIFLIYIILGTQFNSYFQPVLIILSIPFAFVGIVLYLVLSGTPFSTTVLYAGVALAGIAVNDSIVLISYINDRRKDGMSTREAVTDAAATRLRPVLLTTITTISGLIPTALGLGGESVVWGPMASTIIFGLIFSTITALLLVPCLYGILDDVIRRTRRHAKQEA
jgi:multidrug efflux pump subunit AcrB